MGPRWIGATLLLMSLPVRALAAPSTEAALESEKSIGQYVHRVWQRDQGLPQQSVAAIIQTDDGYLWVGTQEGLARFDGVRFAIFGPSNEAAFRAGRITALHKTAGALWIGTERGLVRYADGAFTAFAADGLLDNHVLALNSDASGALLVGTRDGVVRFSDGRFVPLVSLPGERVLAMLRDSKGRQWIGTEHGLQLVVGREGQRTLLSGLTDAVRAIRESGDTIWVGTDVGLFRVAGDRVEAVAEIADRVWSLHAAPNGGLWIGTNGSGLKQWQNGRIRSLTTADGLSNDVVLSIFEDRERTLWVGTHGGGLNSFHNGSFTAYGTREGLVHDVVRSVYEDSDRVVWVGTSGGLTRLLPGGAVETFTTRDGLAYRRILAIEPDANGRMWLGTDGGGLNRFDRGRFSVFTQRNGLPSDTVTALRRDRDGRLWVGTDQGLVRFARGEPGVQRAAQRAGAPSGVERLTSAPIVSAFFTP